MRRNSASQGGLLEDASHRRAGCDPGRLQPSATTAADGHGFVNRRERLTLSRAESRSTDQACVVADQFYGDAEPWGASRKHNGEAGSVRRESRAADIALHSFPSRKLIRRTRRVL